MTVMDESPGTRETRWIFGSYRARSASARAAFGRQWPGLMIRYGRDPIAVGEEGLHKGLYDVYPGPDNESNTRERREGDLEG